MSISLIRSAILILNCVAGPVALEQSRLKYARQHWQGQDIRGKGLVRADPPSTVCADIWAASKELEEKRYLGNKQAGRRGGAVVTSFVKSWILLSLTSSAVSEASWHTDEGKLIKLFLERFRALRCFSRCKSLGSSARVLEERSRVSRPCMSNNWIGKLVNLFWAR